jgi:phospholipase C
VAWETFPEVLDKAGVTWKVYQDLAGATFAPDFGDGGAADNFDGNFTDNSLLYFAQYAASSPGSSLFDNGCTGTSLVSPSLRLVPRRRPGRHGPLASSTGCSRPTCRTVRWPRSRGWSRRPPILPWMIHQA